MLYSEFLENVPCLDNDHNHNVYVHLDAIYMSTDIDKKTIYQVAKCMVKNDIPEEVMEDIEEFKYQIQLSKETIEYYKRCIENNKYYLTLSVSKEEEQHYKEMIISYNSLIKKEKRWIKRMQFNISLTEAAYKLS